MKRFLIILGLALFIISANHFPGGAVLSAQPPKQDTPAIERLDAESFRKEIRALLEEHRLAATTISVKVVSLPDGAEIFSTKEGIALVPASIAKLSTSAAALVELGKDYRFVTRFYVTAKPDQGGVVRGDMIVKGGGDPNISGRFSKSPTELFEKVADDVLKAGVKKITGDLVLDDTMFDRQYVHPDWPRDELEKWYSAGASALSFNDNCVGVVVGPGKKAGDAAVVKVSPPNGCVSIVNKCVTTGSKKLHSFSVTRSASGNHITVNGKFYVKAKPYRVDVAVSRPPLYFGDVLKRVLAAKGVAVGGKVKLATRPFDVKAGGLVAVASLESPLLRTLEVLNGRSQNFYAEQVFKTLGYAKKGKGTFNNGAEAVSAFLARIGAADKGTVVADGSGLSRKNCLTADTVAVLLVAMYDEKYRDDFIATLSVAGKSGSASSRLKEEPYAGRLFVKTGTMSGVSTLAGYAKNLDGRWFAFVVMSNGFPLARTTEFKKLEDEICRLIVRLK